MTREESKVAIAEQRRHAVLSAEDRNHRPEYDGDEPAFEQPSCPTCGATVLWSEVKAGVECAECGATLEG